MVRDSIRDREDAMIHTVHCIGKCLGILQKFLRGSLEEDEITLIVVELWISGLWKEKREGGLLDTPNTGVRSAHSWTCQPWSPPCAVSY